MKVLLLVVFNVLCFISSRVLLVETVDTGNSAAGLGKNQEKWSNDYVSIKDMKQMISVVKDNKKKNSKSKD